MSENTPHISKLTDRELINLAIEGTQEAYTILMERYTDSLYVYTHEFSSRLKNRDGNIEQAEEPQDICQEAFHKAFNSLEHYNPKYEFSTWLFNIARNLAIDYSRKRKIAIAAKISNDNNAEITNIGDGIKNSPEDKLISTQEYQKLIMYIDNLDDKYREVARMRFIKEYAYDEIAKELNLQINTVKTRIKRAKEQLMELINN